jgi:AcrR family transcriptional regulator
VATARPTVKGEARQQILAVAEALFAEHGVEAVSLRKINAAAGVSPGVLHYHFGSREILVAELINRHMSRLIEERENMLRPLQQQERPRVEDIVAALVLPLANFALNGGAEGAAYVRFIARLYADRSPILEEVSARYQAVNSLYPTLLRRALPDTEATALSLRLAMANHAMLQTLADLTVPGRAWLEQADSACGSAQLIAMLVDFMAAGIRGSGA